MSGNSKGFTLIEIMTVVLAMGILLALAVPNIMKYRETSQAKACQVNLRSILAAVEEARLERASFITSLRSADGTLNGDVDMDDLVGGGFLRQELTCPADDSAYTITFSDGNCTVTCGSEKEGHEIGN
jgi:prepilin-type N-terminal cleavage/methylation domain-containing protein